MTRLRRALFSVGFPAAGAALLALTVTFIVALASTDAVARPQLIPASLPRPLPLRVPPKPVKPPLFSPFTGERVRTLKPVLAVKIDNIVDARPQTGLQAADIVYVLPVEGGLTRFMAVFSSHLPPAVGPVRSAREDDLAVLLQFGRPGCRKANAEERVPEPGHTRPPTGEPPRCSPCRLSMPTSPNGMRETHGHMPFSECSAGNPRGHPPRPGLTWLAARRGSPRPDRGRTSCAGRTGG